MSDVQVNATYEHLDAIFAGCHGLLSHMPDEIMIMAKDACKDLTQADKQKLFDILLLEIQGAHGGWFVRDIKTVYEIIFDEKCKVEITVSAI